MKPEIPVVVDKNAVPGDLALGVSIPELAVSAALGHFIVLGAYDPNVNTHADDLLNRIEITVE